VALVVNLSKETTDLSGFSSGVNESDVLSFSGGEGDKAFAVGSERDHADSLFEDVASLRLALNVVTKRRVGVASQT
jgi:hypothetical protein